MGFLLCYLHDNPSSGDINLMNLHCFNSEPPVPKPRKSLTRVDKHSLSDFESAAQPKSSKNPEQQAQVCIEEQPLSFSTENQSQDELRDERQVGVSSMTLVWSAYQKINFLISQPKHVLWVLKRTLSMRRFF